MGLEVQNTRWGINSFTFIRSLRWGKIGCTMRAWYPFGICPIGWKGKTLVQCFLGDAFLHPPFSWNLLSMIRKIYPYKRGTIGDKNLSWNIQSCYMALSSSNSLLTKIAARIIETKIKEFNSDIWHFAIQNIVLGGWLLNRKYCIVYSSAQRWCILG